ncbi:hypothetical protein [Natranaerobius trueperi]|uniref:Transposase InsH N-terminal domain-containing protein n=1 Tax=Natranaerobius trueperi TaxID=759412 RepID=A0A226BWC2_9FIRM|nr:hypothetical protein [Natranaerobius trueperi]OWZ83201.1 hypothetical protein CDO51_09890 [Natranaerobius trueperi]
MKPLVVYHEDYQNFVLEELKNIIQGGAFTLANSDWPVLTKLTDLSYLTTWISSSYSKKGPPPRDPASMLRSYLLLLFTYPSLGLTEWVDMMKKVPLYASYPKWFLPFRYTRCWNFLRLFFSSMGTRQTKFFKRQKRKKKRQKKLKKGQKQAHKNPGFVHKLVKRFLNHDA